MHKHQKPKPNNVSPPPTFDALTALNKLGQEPQQPRVPMLLVTEPTIEGLCRLYVEGHPSLGLFSAEGGQFLGGHGMTEETKLRTSTALSCFWDGEPIRRVRGGDGAQIIANRRLSIHLMCQSEISRMLLNSALLTGQGLLSRFLITAPDSTIGTRFSHEYSVESGVALEKYNKRLHEILRKPLPLVDGKVNELKPRTIPLSAEASEHWTHFADEMETAMADGGEFATIRNFANKLPEHAGRLAAILTLADDLDADAVPVDKMESGIALARHYGREALRIVGASKVSADLHLAQKLLKWLRTSWEEELVSLPDVYQRAPITAIRDKMAAGKIVSILEDHGYLMRVEGGGIVAGVKRRDAWRIVK